MENGPFIDDFPIKTTIYRGFSMAMLNNQMVHEIYMVNWWLSILNFPPLRGQHFTASRDAAAAAALPELQGAVAGGFCRGQLGMAPGEAAAVERLSAVFGFLTDGEDGDEDIDVLERNPIG